MWLNTLSHDPQLPRWGDYVADIQVIRRGGDALRQVQWIDGFDLVADNLVACGSS